MKLSLGVVPDLSTWIPDSIREPAMFQRELRRFLSNFLIADGEAELQQLGQLISQNDRRLLEIYLGVLGGTPRSSIRVAYPDYRPAPPTNILSAEDDGKFLEAMELRTRQAKTEESREEFYDRTLGHLASLSQEVHLYDPYILENLHKQSSGATWLIWSKLAKLPISLSLHTTLAKNWQESDADFKQRLEEEWLLAEGQIVRSLSACAPHSNFRISLDLHRHKKHDRFGRIVFSRGHVNFDLSKGLEVFDRPKLREHFKVNKLEPTEYDERSESWQEAEYSRVF